MSEFPEDTHIDFSALQAKYKPVPRSCIVCTTPLAADVRHDKTTCSGSCRTRLWRARKEVRENLADFQELSAMLQTVIEELESEA